ncbi:MAG TPA: hypothetical protein VFL93_09025 [Longimicrobiaceae bacterium]|nr:hypothetical protein [Longimicrobiaceae bacterium]
MFGLIGLIATGAAAVFGFLQSRLFVRRRLRYVDAVQHTGAAVLAGVAATLVALPVVFFLPLVGAGTAALFGLGVGLGVSAGARDIRKRLPSG